MLLKVALDYRPSPSSKGGEAAVPFAGAQDGLSGAQRPYNFWQWRSNRPYVSHIPLTRRIYRAWLIWHTSYWQFLVYMVIVLIVLELILSPFETLYSSYSGLVGYIGLSVEATLPIPQLMTNARSRSCKGIRLSLLASWILGDAMKMYWFFTSPTEIPWSFKLSGMFQGSCDLMLGIQYLFYGDGQVTAVQPPPWSYPAAKPHVSLLPVQPSSGRTSPFSEKAF